MKKIFFVFLFFGSLKRYCYGKALLMPTLCAFSFQVIGPNQGDAYLKMKLKDQNKAMQMLQESPSLQGLAQIQAPYVDLEVRGLPALQYFGNLVWQDAFKAQTGWS